MYKRLRVCLIFEYLILLLLYLGIHKWQQNGKLQRRIINGPLKRKGKAEI